MKFMKHVKPFNILSFTAILSFVVLNNNLFKKDEGCIIFDETKKASSTVGESFDLVNETKDSFIFNAKLYLTRLINKKTQFYHYTMFADGTQIQIDDTNSAIEAKCAKNIERKFMVSKKLYPKIGAITLFTEYGKQYPDEIFQENYESVLTKYGQNYLGQYDSPQLIFLDSNIPALNKSRLGLEKRTEGEQSRIEFNNQLNSLYPHVRYKELVKLSIIGSGFARKTPIVITCLLNGKQIPIAQDSMVWIGVFKNSEETVRIPTQIRFDKKGWNVLSCYGIDAVYSDNRNSSNHGQPNFIKKSFVYVN
jgi:hypothetical protein